MTRLIDADALIENLEFDIELNQRALDNGDIDHSTREIMQFDKDCKQNAVSLLRKLPTVDAVPVIWCKDCKHRFEGEKYPNCCEVLMEMSKWLVEIPVKDEWHCGSGERKE